MSRGLINLRTHVQKHTHEYNKHKQQYKSLHDFVTSLGEKVNFYGMHLLSAQNYSENHIPIQLSLSPISNFVESVCLAFSRRSELNKNPGSKRASCVCGWRNDRLMSNSKISRATSHNAFVKLAETIS